jgi:hypothetical protein
VLSEVTQGVQADAIELDASMRIAGTLSHRAAGERDMSGWLGPRRHGSQSIGMAVGVKPRSRGAGRLWRRALRATTVPVRLNVDGEIRVRLFSRQEARLDDCAGPLV